MRGEGNGGDAMPARFYSLIRCIQMINVVQVGNGLWRNSFTFLRFQLLPVPFKCQPVLNALRGAGSQRKSQLRSIKHLAVKCLKNHFKCMGL